MLVCPQCQFENPDHHKFCQSCGTSLSFLFCPQCSCEVSLDQLNCWNCGAKTGKVWQAVILCQKPAQESPPQEIPPNLAATDNFDHLMGGVDGVQDQMSSNWDVITTLSAAEVTSTESSLMLAQDYDTDSVLETVGDDSMAVSLSDEHEEEGLLQMSNTEQIGDRDLLSTDTELSPPSTSMAEVDTSEEATVVDKPVYLDSQGRYKLLEPRVSLQLGEMARVPVLDCKPLQVSPLEALQLTPDDPQNRSALLIPAAQVYWDLYYSYPQHFPKVHDAWEEADQAIVLLPDCSDLPDFEQKWHDIQTPLQQIVAWLQQMAQLWEVLEPGHYRQSLLRLDNLAISGTAPGSLFIKQLYADDPEKLPTLGDLGQLWQSLFKLSGRTLMGSITQMLRDLRESKLEGVEQLRLKLDEIMAELTPAQQRTTEPQPSSVTRLQTGVPITGSSGQIGDAPTVPRLPQLLDLQACGRTDVGKERSQNEDCFGLQTLLERQEIPGSQTLYARGLYIISDGMGGHAGGEVASRMAVHSLKEYFQTHWADSDSLPSEQLILNAIAEANEAIYRVNMQGTRSGSGRMGTTLVLVIVANTQVAIAHVGDSRLYSFTRSQGLRQMTVDHEVGQREIARGVDPEIAYTRPDAYQLTQALGPRDSKYLKPDVRFWDITEDTLLLLASDGLTDNDLVETYCHTHIQPLIDSQVSLDRGVDGLIDLANEHNGHDNITAIAIRVLAHHRD
ncbi:MAG: serine/threonine phosphatase [Limnospira sp. PMC 894.15]|uniref:serine/threonine phosphatase n=1 Tax=Limnospira sp. PMC 894.15 TaxID=2981100 RepID=UPI0028E10C8B|nr:serine/threonine phosphatase [Limnospira sp. PMC 894.15]MDT9188931.1 serine/threonine phosphatase [Limnospira sp. PMC 894.15]